MIVQVRTEKKVVTITLPDVTINGGPSICVSNRWLDQVCEFAEIFPFPAKIEITRKTRTLPI